MNFWDYLIDGVTSILGVFLNQFPAALPNEILRSVPAQVSNVIAPVYYWVSPLIDLKIIGLVIGLVLVLETIRAIIAIWRWILTIIPAAS